MPSPVTLAALSAALQTAAVSLVAAAAPAPLRIDGLVAAVFSPFDAASNLNLSVVPAQAAYLKATGVKWAYTCGTTGESLSLTVPERKALTEAWLKVTPYVIAHVAAEALGDARELAAHAEKAGVKAIAAMPPTFFKPATVQALALTIASICNAAPSVPCYYYHIPSMTGVTFADGLYDFVGAIEPLAPSFAGIKYTGLYTHPGYMDAQRILNYKKGKYEVLSGREEMMLESLAIGMTGHVGSQFNFAGDLYNQIRSKFGAEGLTPSNQVELRSLQMTAITSIKAWQGAAPVGTNGAKAFMNLAGLPVGDARLPAVPLDTSAQKALKNEFGDFCSTHRDLQMCGGA